MRRNAGGFSLATKRRRIAANVVRCWLVRTQRTWFLFSDPDIPGRYLHEPIVSDHVQVGRVLSRRARATGAVTVPEQIGHGHLDVGRPRSVRI